MSRMTNSELLEKVRYTLPDDKNHFNCAISFDVMDDPVIDPHTLNSAAMEWLSASSAEKAMLDCGNFKEVPRYDRKMLEKLIGRDGTGKSPSTRLLFTAQELIPDPNLKSQIDLFMHPFREQAVRLDIESEAQITFSRVGLFFARRAPGAATTSRAPSDAVNPILQLVVDGEESVVKLELETIKSNAAQLSALLSDTGTVKDYSNRTITDMTLLQAAAAAGDIEMCQMLRPYFDLIPSGQQEFETQLAEIFSEGIEAHEIEQQRNAFNFNAVFAAICAASTTDLDTALDRHDNGSALYRALEEFRDEFTKLSNREKIFNPQHLLRAFEAYSLLYDQCIRDGSDSDYRKRNLFWRQIIGYIQRFMPACYAQAFSQGLHYLVKVNQDESWRPAPLKRDLNFSYFSYFPVPFNSRSDLGFDFAIYVTPQRTYVHHRIAATLSKTFCREKQQAFRALCSECFAVRSPGYLTSSGV